MADDKDKSVIINFPFTEDDLFEDEWKYAEKVYDAFAEYAAKYEPLIVIVSLIHATAIITKNDPVKFAEGIAELVRAYEEEENGG